MKLEYTLQIKALAQKTIAKVLLTQPVYKFKGDDLKHQLAKSTLESVTAKNKKLLVTLTFF